MSSFSPICSTHTFVWSIINNVSTPSSLYTMALPIAKNGGTNGVLPHELDLDRTSETDNNDDTIIEPESDNESDQHQHTAPETKENGAGQIEDNLREDLSDEEDDEPPILKYTRLSLLPPNFFKNDPISSLYFHDNVFIFGTHTGLILITKPDFAVVRSFRAHKASILSLYTDGLYFASGSMDGTVVTGSVSDANDIVMFDYKRPVHAVVLDKNFQKTRSFIYGGMSGKVVYSYKSWLDQRSELVLDDDNGAIVGIQTIDDLLLWMNDKGITIYHITTKQVISTITKPSDSFRSDLYWPRICFPETNMLLIAWGNYIWSLKVSVKGSGGSGAGTSIRSRYLPSAPSLSFRSANEKKVEVEHVYKMDFLISGISSFKDDLWIVLVYNQPEKDEETGKVVAQNPDLKLVSSTDGSTVHEEEIGFNFTEHLGLNDYHLGKHIGEKSVRYFIMSARDAIVAEQIQLDDRLQWYLDRQMYLEAWNMSQHIVQPIKRLKYGVWYIESLTKQDEWAQAAQMIEKILHIDPSEFPLGDTKSTLNTKNSVTSSVEDKEVFVKEVSSQWSHWISIFIESGHTKEITSVAPADTRWNLPKQLFSEILEFWLDQLPDDETFYDLISRWDNDLYETNSTTEKMEFYLEQHEDNVKLRRQLCSLYERSYNPRKAVPHLVILRDSKIFDFLVGNHIMPFFVPEIPKFIEFKFDEPSDLERLPVNKVRSKVHDVISILADARHEIAPSEVIKVMFENHIDVINYFYIEELVGIDELLVKDFEDVRIQLYGQYDRPKLLSFITTHDGYDIATAIEVCERNSLIDELVYLLGKVGENKKAMQLIMEQLDDPEGAIRFAKIQNDKETWNLLLQFSYSRPKFIKALIELSDDQSNAIYNPITILQNMDTDVEVEGLRESVIKVEKENDITLIVNELILRIVTKRSESISKTYHSDIIRGMEIVEAEFEQYSSEFEALAIMVENSQGKHRLVKETELVPGSQWAKRPFTTLKSKLEHLKWLCETVKN